MESLLAIFPERKRACLDNSVDGKEPTVWHASGQRDDFWTVDQFEEFPNLGWSEAQRPF